MMVEELSEGQPFSEGHELLLQSVFDKINQREDIDSHEILETEIREEISKIEDQLQNSYELSDWERYFTKISHSEPAVYTLNINSVSRDWVASLIEHTEFENPTISSNEDGTITEVKIETHKRGNITFSFFYDAEELLKSSPQDRDSDFLIAFQTPTSGIERDCVFRWQDVRNSYFPDEVRRYLIENQIPPTIELYNSGSYTAKNVPDGPIRALKSIAKDREHIIKNQPQLIDNIQLSGEELDVSSLTVAIEIDTNIHLVACNCQDSSAENTHVHLIEGGELVSPYSNEEAESILETLFSKIEDYNDLNDDYENVSKMDRILQVFVVIMIIPSLRVVVSWLLDNDVNTGLLIGNLLALILLIVVAVFIWGPLLELRLFSWETPCSPDGLINKIVDKIN